MQFLDFFDFLTNSVMMPIAAIATCLLISKVVGTKKIEEEVLLGERYLPQKKNLQFYDPLPLPDFCSDHSDQLCGECVWMDFHVKKDSHKDHTESRFLWEFFVSENYFSLNFRYTGSWSE